MFHQSINLLAMDGKNVKKLYIIEMSKENSNKRYTIKH